MPSYVTNVFWSGNSKIFLSFLVLSLSFKNHSNCNGILRSICQSVLYSHCVNPGIMLFAIFRQKEDFESKLKRFEMADEESKILHDSLKRELFSLSELNKQLQVISYLHYYIIYYIIYIYIIYYYYYMARTATHKPRTNKDKVTELHLATYNVRTLSDECHLVSLENEIEKIKWDIIGISEMRRPGENVVELASQHIMFNKGNDKKQGGVGFLIHKKLKGNIEEFHATSNRVASVTIRISKRYKIIIIQVYAPTSVSSQEELEEFYDDLQTEMRHKKTHYNVIMGDFNAKVGKGDEDCVGSFGYGVRNDRGDDLINFATAHGFKIMNTYYKKKKNRRWTWRSPNFETFNEIDYVLVDKNNIVKNFEVLNKVNVDSDHRMIRCKVQIDSKQERKKTISFKT